MWSNPCSSRAACSKSACNNFNFKYFHINYNPLQVKNVSHCLSPSKWSWNSGSFVIGSSLSSFKLGSYTQVIEFVTSTWANSGECYIIHRTAAGNINIGGSEENTLSIHWYVIVRGQSKVMEEYSKDRLFPRNSSYHITQLSSFHTEGQGEMRSAGHYKEKKIFYYIMNLISTTCTTKILLCVISVGCISWQVENSKNRETTPNPSLGNNLCWWYSRRNVTTLPFVFSLFQDGFHGSPNLGPTEGFPRA